MNKLIRFYNQNRREFWTVVVSIILIFIVIQILESYYKSRNEEEKNNNENNNVISVAKKDTTYAISSGDVISEETSKNTNYVIEQFINYCNSKDINNAYNILSTECKEELYKTEEDFKKDYIDVLFNSSKMHEVELWKTYNNKNIFLIKFTEDILATGDVDGAYIQDYYTVVEENGEYKLNVNSYVGKEKIEKETEKDNVNISVIEKNIYMDYEEYKIQIKNKTKGNVCIDKKESTKTMFITTSKDINYYANSYELEDNSLILKPGQTRTYNIKFERSFKNDNITKKINFTNILLNYNAQNEKNIEIYVDL